VLYLLLEFCFDEAARLTSRRSQPPLALSVPLSRFTPRVGGGSAFYVRCQSGASFTSDDIAENKAVHAKHTDGKNQQN